MKSSITIVALAALGTCGCAEEPAAPATPPDPYTTVASNKQLMQAIVIPASDAIWALPSAPPTDDAGWLAAENKALSLAESGNLLMMGSRAVDHENWTKFSTALIGTATAAVEGIRARDADAISAAGDAIYEVCEGCHLQYLPKPQE